MFNWWAAETLGEFRHETTVIGVALGILENLARGRYGSFGRDFTRLLGSDNSPFCNGRSFDSLAIQDLTDFEAALYFPAHESPGLLRATLRLNAVKNVLTSQEGA